MINIKGVEKTFKGLFRPILNGLNLNIVKGDFCVLIGANGCGKSTLLKLISSEYTAEQGVVEVNGTVAQVVQDANLGTVQEMTLLENIALSHSAKPKFAFYRRYKEQIIAKLKVFNIGLEAYIDQPLKMLSGGQRQMVATLMAINSGREILLLDEHTSALDPKMQAFLMEYTSRQIIERKLTTIMITHKMDDAIKYGNRLIMLHQGRIVLDIQNEQKQALQVQDLLTLFHQYEDEILISRGEDDN